jgi:hypothetical protein
MKTLGSETDKNALMQRLRRVKPDSARRWGRMSAHQMICHLSDSFKAATGEKAVSSLNKPILGIIAKWFAVYVPIPWPHGLPTRPEMDQDQGGTKPVEFARDLAELETLVERFTGTPRDFDWHAHPLFGEMSDHDWWRWGYLHMDHHLRQFGV